MVQKQHILVIEDDPADVFLIRDAIQTARIAADVHVVHDGLEASRFFEQADRQHDAPCPAIIILDLNLPKKDGHEVLRDLRNSRCANSAVIVVTSSGASNDREAAEKIGVDSYFRKPSDYDAYMKLGDIVRALMQGHQHPE